MSDFKSLYEDMRKGIGKSTSGSSNSSNRKSGSASEFESLYNEMKNASRSGYVAPTTKYEPLDPSGGGFVSKGVYDTSTDYGKWKTVEDWAQRYNAAMSGVSAYQRNLGGGYSEDYSGGYLDDIDALIAEYGAISGYADTMGLRNSKSYYNSLEEVRNALVEQNNLYGSKEAYDKAVNENNWYNTYNGKTTDELMAELAKLEKDSDEYNWVAGYYNYQDEQEKLGYDVEAGQKAVGELEKELAKFGEVNQHYQQYVNNGGDPDNIPDSLPWAAEYKRLVSEYGSYDQLTNDVAKQRRYAKQAERAQELNSMSSVALEGSANYDPEFWNKIGYETTMQDSWWSKSTSEGGLGYGDLTYEYINNPDGNTRDYILENYDGSRDRFVKLDKMTDDQVALYNYYYSTEGKKAADRYLELIEEDINRQMAADMYSRLEGKTGAELAFGVSAGLDQFYSGMSNIFDQSDYIPASATQYASGMVREDLADNRLFKNKTTGTSLGQGVYDTITTTANMAPSILASVALNYAAPGLGSYVGSALMGASAGGNAYAEMLNAGYSKDQARAYGTLVGVSEVVMEKAIGGISALGGGNLSGAVLSKLDDIDNGLARFAKGAGGQIIANAGSEAIEEAVQSILEPIIYEAISGEEKDVDWSEVAYSALLGALTGGVFEAGTQGINAAVKAGTDIKAGKSVQNPGELNTLAAELSPGLSAADQQTLAAAQKKAESNKTRHIGALYNTVSEIVTSQDSADIVKSLTRKGISEESATKMAELITGYMNDTLTDYGKDKFNGILKDKRVQTVVTDLINNKMSTVGQRNQKLAAATGKEASTIDVAKVKAQQHTEFVEENNEYDVAADQQTINTKTGATVKVNDIAEITDKGVVNVQLDDGSVVNAADLSYATEDIALAYSALKGKPMSAENANRLFKMSEGMDAAEFYEAVEDGYERGYANLAKPEGEVAAAAYEAGVAQRASEGGNAEVNKNASGINYISKKGDVTKIDTKDKSKDLSLNKRQRAAVNTMQTLQKLNLGTAFYLFESHIEVINGEEKIVFTDEYGKRQEAPDGMYYKDGRIYIDINAGAGRNGRIMLQTVAHELTHHIQEWNSAKYKVLADFLAAEYGKRGVDTYSAIKAKQQELSEVRGSTVSFNEAYHEFVADSLSVMFNDGNLYNKLVKLKQTDSALFNELNEFISKLAEKVRKLFNNDRAETAEGRFVQSWDAETIERLQQTFAEALVEASGNYESALNSVAKPDAKPVSKDEIITDGVTVTDGVGKQLSVKSMKADIAEGKMFEDLKRVLKWSDAKVNALRTNLTNLVHYMAREEVRGIVDMNESYGREGRRFSPFKPNSDPLYKISLDFSTLCSKRLLTQFVIENLQLREKRPMTAEEQMAIRAMLNEYRKVENGLQVACAMCYVEAARLKSPKQIQRWLDNPEPLLRDYFAKKNKEFNDSVKEAQADFKESRGYDRNATKKDMKGSDIKELNKIGPRMRANYKLSAEESAIVERALKLPEGTYLTAANLATLSETEPVIYNAYSSFVRTATRSKGLETDEPYYYGDSTRDNGNGIIVSDSFIEDVNRENGMRFSSWSDWRIQHMLDYITAVIDMSVRGAAMHGYTKFGDEVRVLGKTGMMFNMSGVAGTQTGLNEDGSLSFSETESIDADEAIQLREEFPDTAGLQCIGVSKEHIIALLASDIIDYVIPYHTSGLNAALRRMADIHGWKDFTGTQNASVDKSVKYEDAVDQERWHEEPVFSEFFVGYNTGMTGIEAMRQSAENYKRMCRERGMTPKFNEFANEENYWKLLIDRKMINQKTGNLIKQMPVTPEFDFDLIKDIVDKTVTNYDSGMESRALNHIVENWDTIPQRIRDLKKKGTAKAKKTAKAVDTLSNQTLAAMPKDVQLSVKRNIVDVKGRVYERVIKPGLEVYIKTKHSAYNYKKHLREKIFNRKFNVLDANGSPITLEFGKAGETVHKKGVKSPHKVLGFFEQQTDKLTRIAIFNIKELAKNSVPLEPHDDPRHGWMDENGWHNRLSYMMDEDKVYPVILQVPKTRDGRYLIYEIDVLKKEETSIDMDATAPTAQSARAFPSKEGPAVDILESSADKTTTPQTESQEENAVNPQKSDRLTEPSTREILATALEGTAKTELEQKVISEYIDTIPKLNEQEAKLNELNAQIREMSFGKGPRDTKKLNQLKTEAAKTRNRINILDKKLLRIESTVPLQRVIETEKAKAVKREKARGKEALAAAKERSAQKIAEVRKTYQESRANSVAGRRKTEMRHKIQRVVKQLNDLLLHETKEKHIPKSLKKAVADALDFVNMDTVGAEERIAKYEAMIAKETDPAKIDAYTATIENIRRQGERSGEMLNALKDAYKEISKSNDPEIMNAYDAEIYGNLAELAATIGNTSLRDMTIEQLQDVYSMYRMVLTTVQNANKLFREGRKETLVQLTQKVYNEIDAVPHKERDLPPALHKVQRWLRNFSWNELRPVDAFDRVGSKEFTELFWDIIKAQGEYGHMVEEVMDFMTTARKKHNYSKWDLTKATTYDTVNGKQFKVTLEDAMSIYAYSKRDQAHDHMTDGGFTYDTGRTYKDEKNGRKVSPVLSTPYRVTDVEIGEIIGSLTKEQRAYVDEVQQFLTDFGKKGNVVSNALWGIDLFTEKMYFPLKSSKDYRSSTEQALNATQTMVSLKNNGMTKATVPHANNPIVLRAFDDVVLEHLDTMSKYAAYVLPVENIQRVFNSVAKNSNEDYVSIQSLLTSVFGDSATAYFNQYIKDINGNTASTGAQSPIGSFFSKSKAAAVAANLSVVIQQYSSIVRAMAEIHPKFFNWFNPPTKTTLKTYEEIKKYAGVAVIKEMGGFDVSSNRGIKDFVGFEEAPASREKAWKKFQDLTGWGAQQMDKVGWNTIWRAVKREVTASGKFKVGSEEFYQECGRRFTEVVTKTQVYDSVNSRSGFMRSKSDSVKYLTTYMGEPTVTVGMVFRSHLNLIRAVQSKQGVGAAAKNLARTGAVLACTMMLNAALKSVAYAMRDDDEDEAFIERWAKSVGDSVKNDLNIFNMLPVFRDIMSVIDGWDVERPDMSVITEMINATRTFAKPFLDEEKMEQMEPTDWWNNSVKLVGAIGNMVGVPLKNIIRDTTGVVRLYGDITDELKPEDVGGAFARGFTGKEQSKAESLYDAIVAGEDSRLEFLRTTYDNEAEYEKAVKSALRDNDERIEAAAEARYSGNWSEYERIFGEIEAEGNFTRSQIGGAVESAMRDLEPEEVAGEADVKNYGIYNKNDFAVAVFSGDKKSAEKIRNEIVKFMVAEGKTKDEATKSLDSFIRDSVKDWLETGDVDRNEAISALTQFASYDSKKATVKVDYWMYAMDHPGTYVSEDIISSYYEYGKSAGISMDVYVNYRNKIRGIEGDGKKENILPIINSMPISNAQKDALYFSHGWAKSRLSEAPWH